MKALISNPPGDFVHIGSYEYALPENILYCEGDRNYTHVHFVNRKRIFVATNLGILESRLVTHGFKRINRSYLVNANHIVNYDRYEITVANGGILPIARRRRVEVRMWLSELGTSTRKLWKPQLASLLMLLCFITGASAQSRLFHIPPLAPDSCYVLPLNHIGLKLNHYSVLVKVRLPGDTTFYTLPGVLPTGDAFGFLLKAGRKGQTDTLRVIHRGGMQPVELAEIWVQAFHKNDHLLYDRQIFGKPDRGFAKAVLSSYYDQHTLRGSWVIGRKKRENIPVQPDILQLSEPTISYVPYAKKP